MILAMIIISSAVYGFSSYIACIRYLHMAQLEGYKPRQYWWWIKHNPVQPFLKEGIIFIAAGIFYVIARLQVISFYMEVVLSILWAIGGIYLIYIGLAHRREAKKPLVFTFRATRLFITSLVLMALWGVLGYLYSVSMVDFIFYLAVAKLLLPFNMLLSTAVIYPLEMLVQYRFFKSAQTKIMSMKNLKVIGITGSYGKTSTKYFLKTILSEKYNTLMTPESYNTPMGITKVIREQLNDKHEVFVCEMGARNVGDIKTLCKLVNPEIGILTSIGPQHLETFKSIANVAKTKYELMQSLPYYGTAIFNGDNSYCLNLARKTGIETLVYGIENKSEDIFLFASEVKNSREGLKFRVRNQEGMDFECRTGLLGKHNVSNLLGAICASIRLGLTPEEIQSGLSKIEPVPHRLQILDTNNGVTVIDDAFNSNPVGAREALEAIKEMTGGDRIVITPGMVELGAVEYEENKKFGKVMADCCDYAILVGVKRSKPIIEGLKLAGFPEERIIVTSNLNEATTRMGEIIKAGDVVLFENDLPDNYNEPSFN